MRSPPRTLLGVALGLLGALLVWQIVAEAIEPFYSLALVAPFRRLDPPIEAPSAGGSLLRLYPDARPHVGKIARLQKGLVWVVEGRELIQEGYGFGLPIIEYQGRAYSARHAEVERYPLPDGVRLVKRFHMDTVDTPIRFLRRKYRSVPSLGHVTLQYDVHPDGRLRVHADFTGLEVAWERAYLMVEQGSNHFTRLILADGSVTEAADLGIWHPTTALPACFESGDGRRRFCVIPDEPVDAYVGRERYLQYNWRGVFYLAWSGIDLTIPRLRASFDFTVALEAT